MDQNYLYELLNKVCNIHICYHLYRYKNLFDYLKEINSDLIGINKKYFNKYRTRDYDYFKNSKYSVKTNIQLNKKGLIFEVKHND